MKISTISFTSLKSQKRLGEKAIKEYKQEFPYYFHSDTKVCAMRTALNDKSKSKMNFYELYKIRQKYSREIINMRLFLGANYGSWDEYVEALKKAMLATKAANCGEEAVIIQDILLKKGIKARYITMGILDVTTAKEQSAHSFIVIGIKDGARFSKPKTWGNEAVVVDPWANIVLDAPSAIEYYKKILEYDPKKNIITFKKADLIDIDSYLQNNIDG